MKKPLIVMILLPLTSWSHLCALDVKTDDYKLTIADGYGWNEKKTALLPPGSKLVMKDGGMKSIMIAVTDVKDANLETANSQVEKGMEASNNSKATSSRTIDWGNRKTMVVEFSGKNPDGDVILGVYRVFVENHKGVVITCYSGFVKPGDDEELTTIVNTLTRAPALLP